MKVRVNQRNNMYVLLSFLISTMDNVIPIKLVGFEYIGHRIQYSSLATLIRYLEKDRVIRKKITHSPFSSINGYSTFKSKPTLLYINRRRLISYARDIL